ncbi:MAG: Autotransporter-associated beta strand repeat-containing protein, partial [Verrucomicrobia bacterium]
MKPKKPSKATKPAKARSTKTSNRRSTKSIEPRTGLQWEQLEPRILYSAAPVEAPVEKGEAEAEAADVAQALPTEAGPTASVSLPAVEAHALAQSQEVAALADRILEADPTVQIGTIDFGLDTEGRAGQEADSGEEGGSLWDAADGSPLELSERPLGGVAPSTGEHPGLDASEIGRLAREAISRWSSTGLAPDQIEALGRITYRIENLEGNRLGYADGMVIVIDADAAGRSWFIDRTASVDEEFDLSDVDGVNAVAETQAFDRYDLLSTLMHEQGHVLGLADRSFGQTDVMYAFLQAGQRRLPALGQAEGAQVSLVADGVEYLTAAFVWTGAAGDGNAANGANWAGGVAPSTMDDLVFGSAGAGTIDFSGFAPNTRFQTIQINGSGFTLTGNSIELYGGLTVNNATGTNNVALEITLVNAQTIMNANSGAVLNLSGPIHTGGLLGTSSVFNTSALTFDGAGNINVSGTIDGQGSVTKLGRGALALSVANTYEGITDLRQGVVVTSNGNAFGTGLVTVQAGASVRLSGGITVANPLAIREAGVGFANGDDPAAFAQLGALRSLAGSNTWSGAIELAGGNNLIGVDAGSTLNLSGVIASGLSNGNNLYKVGEGTLQITGTEANVFRGATRVLQGTLELGKTAGLDALGGAVVIGDDIERTGTKTLRLLNANQIRHLDQYETGVLTVTMGSTGVFDLNGQNETVGRLILTNGVTQSSLIDLNGATLTMQGATLQVNAFQGSSGASPASAIIDGTFNIGTLESTGGIAAVIDGGGATKNFVINDTQLANAATDLVISANLVGASDVSITRSGAGTMRISGDNSGLLSPYVMNGGIDEVASNNAYGSGTISLQNDGNVLRAIGARTLANTIHLNGNITTFGDDLTFTGSVTLTGDRSILTMDAAQTVSLQGAIGEGIFG